VHLPNYYSDEQWNDLTDEQRERASRLYERSLERSDDNLNDQIAALYEEANEYEANAEGTSDLVHASQLRREAEQLIDIQRQHRDTPAAPPSGGSAPTTGEGSE
jgi:hypothetical protein